MTIRKSKNGIARSIFLSPEKEDYCKETMTLFSESLGLSRVEIERKLKLLELKVQNPKIIKGLALILFRDSKMISPGSLDPVKVRELIFQRVTIPPISLESRDQLLSSIAEELNSTGEDVLKSMYGDMDKEQLLKSVWKISIDSLSKKYNQEQVETVLLKSVSIRLILKEINGRLIRKLRSLGLLYTENVIDDSYVLEISGPLSIEKHSERYGMKLALFVRFLIPFSEWSLEARIILTSSGKKVEYKYYIDDSVKEYLPDRFYNEQKLLPNGYTEDTEGIQVVENKVYSDYIINLNACKVHIFITKPKYYDEDLILVNSIKKIDWMAEIFCLVDPHEKCPKGAKCMKGDFNFNDALKLIETKYSREKSKNVIAKDISLNENGFNFEKNISSAIIKHLSDLYPDSQAMVDYLDFMGFLPAETLEKIGYNIKWHGLRIEVI
jgi:predicted nuclease of restriction endonuclease-like RecB superfamily